MIEFCSHDVDFTLDQPSLTSKWLCHCVETEGFQVGDITVIFCSDEYLLSVNKEYLQHDYYTDIITFDYSEDGLISGDLFVSIDRVVDNAKEFNQVFISELNRILVHGVMHLCGYLDKTQAEKEEMTFKENHYLQFVSSNKSNID
jgi:rRNA maturation RNase YbeY